MSSDVATFLIGSAGLVLLWIGFGLVKWGTRLP